MATRLGFTPDKLDAFRKGDNMVFSELYNVLKDPIYSIAFKILKIREDAEDVVSETFEKLIKNRESIDFPFNTDHMDRIEGWLCRVVRNASIDRLKARRKNWHYLISPTDMDSLDKLSDPEIDFQGEVYAEIIDHFNLQAQRFLQELAPRRQEAFRLYHLENWEVEAIADHMGISAKTVYVHISKAKKQLYKKLKKSGNNPFPLSFFLSAINLLLNFF
jgi:RNA polymerase sigma-70 factor (ECF subfamily)